MVHGPTLRKLQEMHLSAMADAYENQLLDPNFQALSFEERLDSWLTRSGPSERTTDCPR
jgi:hypothetical protein